MLEKTDVTSELQSLILLVQSKPSESSAPTEEIGPLDYAFEVLEDKTRKDATSLKLSQSQSQ